MCGLVPIPDIYRIILHLLYIIAVIAVELFFGVQFMRFFRYISECYAYIYNIQPTYETCMITILIDVKWRLLNRLQQQQ